MLLLRITGSQLKAARALANLSIGEVSRRAELNRASIRKWESSSDTVPSANLAHLIISRMVDVLARRSHQRRKITSSETKK